MGIRAIQVILTAALLSAVPEDEIPDEGAVGALYRLEGQSVNDKVNATVQSERVPARVR
jgi:hypothetical protein